MMLDEYIKNKIDKRADSFVEEIKEIFIKIKKEQALDIKFLKKENLSLKEKIKSLEKKVLNTK